jgi:hypothetical protein
MIQIATLQSGRRQHVRMGPSLNRDIKKDLHHTRNWQSLLGAEGTTVIMRNRVTVGEDMCVDFIGGKTWADITGVDDL